MKRKHLSMMLAIAMTASALPTFSASAALSDSVATAEDLLANDSALYTSDAWKKGSANAKPAVDADGTNKAVTFTTTNKANRDAYYPISGADSQEEVDVSFDIELQAQNSSHSTFSVRSAYGDLLTLKNSNGNSLELNGTEIENFVFGANENYHDSKGGLPVKTTGTLHVSAELYFGSQQCVKNVVITDSDNTAVYSSGSEELEFTYKKNAPDAADSTGVTRLYALQFASNSAYPSIETVSNISVIADTSVYPVITSKTANNTVDIYPNESAILAVLSNYSTDYAPNEYTGADGTIDGTVTIDEIEYDRYAASNDGSTSYYIIKDGKKLALNAAGDDYAVHPEMHVYLTMSDGQTTLDSRDTGIAQLEDTYARVNFSEGVTSEIEAVTEERGTGTYDDDGNEIMETVVVTPASTVKADNILVVKGLRPGTVTITVDADNTNGGLKTNSVSQTFTVNVKSVDDADSWEYSNGKDLTSANEKLFDIDFDNDTTKNYNVFRVYSSSGYAEALNFYNNAEQVMLSDTSRGMIDPAADKEYKKTDSIPTTDAAASSIVNDTAAAQAGTISYDGTELARTAKSSNSAIANNALFSWAPLLSDVSATGAYLRLNNSNTQRTDKINVTYDFAMYNTIGDAVSGVSKAERGTVYGMPQSISMVSEGVQEGGMPYDFVPSSHYMWPEARPSTIDQINKHLLTFFTGRSKGDKDGMHSIDMTNTLAYFEPRINRYLDLGLPLSENAYNYFHVDADIDFLNCDIEFTITNVDTGASNTIRTTIPKYASWSGFIMNSAQASHMITNVSGGTEHKSYSANHYMYLDNISAAKIGKDEANITPATVPTEKPIPSGSIINGMSESETWKYPNNVLTVTPAPEKEGGEVYYSEGTAGDGKTFTDFYKENNSGGNVYGTRYGSGTNDTYNFHDAVISNSGLTEYVDFDFYLPKEGSYISLAPRGSNGENYGNVIVITNAGAYSWATMEKYTQICGPLETGKWYTMEIMTDNKTRNMIITVSDENGKYGSTTDYSSSGTAYMRSIGNNGIFNRIDVNEMVTNESSGLPNRVWSEATTYLANFRFYQVATRTEYYPEGYTADENGNALNTAGETDNSARLTYLLDNFDQNKVSGTSGAVSIGSTPAPQQSASNPKATFTGWQEIYSSDDDRYIKYAPKFEVLDVDPQDPVEDKDGYYYQVFNTSVTRNAPEWTYDRIKWTVYDKGSEDSHMDGIWEIKAEDLPHNTGNFDLTVNISHCVFKIPIGTEITAEAQAGYSSYGSGWNSLPTELEPTVTVE